MKINAINYANTNCKHSVNKNKTQYNPSFQMVKKYPNKKEDMIWVGIGALLGGAYGAIFAPIVSMIGAVIGAIVGLSITDDDPDNHKPHWSHNYKQSIKHED